MGLFSGLKNLVSSATNVATFGVLGGSSGSSGGSSTSPLNAVDE